eukprot:TRINITY_DN31479_c1_g2_i1.p4 TRINITY_DN31479_c1_g2~~TRINITY_DN31479_c1_g2_i1.p4  ORF type:complete len:149 (-),score=24.65 TRINITY_DN31479_c1_g2_i1:806-1252(-)
MYTHTHSQTQLTITFPVTHTHIPSHHPHPSSLCLLFSQFSLPLSLSVLNHPTISLSLSLSTHLTTLSLPLTTHYSLHHPSSSSYLSSPSFSIMRSFLPHPFHLPSATHISTFLPPLIYRPTSHQTHHLYLFQKEMVERKGRDDGFDEM